MPGVGSAAVICVAFGATFSPGTARCSPDDHHAVVGLQAGGDHPQRADPRAGGDGALLHHVVLVHHQQVAAGLVGAERRVGHQQRLGLLGAGNGTRTRTKKPGSSAWSALGRMPRTISVPVLVSTFGDA